MINSDEFVDLNKCVNEEEINSLFLYVDRYFSDIELTNAQLENCAKLSNYIKRNNLVIGDIESERLIENSKIFNMFNILNNNGNLIRAAQYFNISSLLEMYCLKYNVELIKDNESGIYDRFSHDLDLIKLYLNEISGFRVLSAEEECNLVRLSNLGDMEARNKLINHNLRLVVSVAKNYINCGLDFGDLIQCGNEGLMIAIRKFNPDMGYRFSTYATYWIRSIVTRGIASSSRNIRIPYGLHEIMIKIKKIMNTYIVVHNGKIPTDKELAEITGFSLERVKTARECMDMNISLYTPVGGEDSDATLCDTIPDNTNIEDSMIEYQMKDYLNELITMARLTEREEFVIKARNGFYGRTYTLAELGIKYNVTREMIRQIEMKTLEKLKKTAKLKNSLILINQDYRYDSSYDRTGFKYSL